MSAKPFTTEKSGVILSRMGVGREEYALPEGATLAKLLQMTQVDTEGQSIFVDGKPLEEYVILQPGMIVTIVPRAKNAANKERWSETIGMLKDDPTFQEFVDRVQTHRDRGRGKNMIILDTQPLSQLQRHAHHDQPPSLPASPRTERRGLAPRSIPPVSPDLRRCAELDIGADQQPACVWKGTRTSVSVLGPRRMARFHLKTTQKPSEQSMIGRRVDSQ